MASAETMDNYFNTPKFDDFPNLRGFLLSAVKEEQETLYSEKTWTDEILEYSRLDRFPLEDLMPPTELKRDPLTDYSLVQLSFLLNHFLPCRHVSTFVTKWKAAKLEEFWKRKRIENLLFRPEIAGSIPEGFAVPMYCPVKDLDKVSISSKKTDVSISDYDCVWVRFTKLVDLSMNDDSEVSYIMETDHTYPGYCRLVVGSSMASRKSYLSSEDLVNSVLQFVLSYADIEKDTDLFQQGPAVTLDPNNKKELEMGIDIVQAYPCLTWPEDARKWLSRKGKSGWPSNELKEKLVSEGCLVVAVPHHSSKWPEVEWRISFTRAERALAVSLGDVPHHCMVMIKVLVKYILAPLKAISSYHLKTLLFWTCEKVAADVWSNRQDGLASCMLLLIDELLEAINNHYLPHYFFPTNNLFSNIQPDAMQAVKEGITCLRGCLPQTIFDFDKEYVFTFNTCMINLEYTFDDLMIKDQEMSCQDVKSSYQMQVCVLEKYANQMFVYGNVSEMIEVVRELCQILKTVFDKDVDCVDYIVDIVTKHLSGDLEYLPFSLGAYENLVKRFPEHEGITTIKSDAACLNHNVAYSTPFNDHDLLVERARILFEEATSGKPTAATWTDYANFLYKEGPIEKAMECAMNAISIATPVDGNVYDMKDFHTVPNCLQKDITLDKELDVKSVHYSNFLFALCHVDEGAEDVAADILNNLEEDILSLPTASFSGCKLLGYGWLALNDYAKAKSAFDLAAGVQPSSKAASCGQELCENILDMLRIETDLFY